MHLTLLTQLLEGLNSFLVPLKTVRALFLQAGFLNGLKNLKGKNTGIGLITAVPLRA